MTFGIGTLTMLHRREQAHPKIAGNNLMIPDQSKPPMQRYQILLQRKNRGAATELAAGT
jgi:hypothetical protein